MTPLTREQSIRVVRRYRFLKGVDALPSADVEDPARVAARWRGLDVPDGLMWGKESADLLEECIANVLKEDAQ